MIKFIRQIWESLRFASQALKSNLLRTTLSLLGVSIGIFAIIAVFTIVDSLEKTIRQDMSFIGNDVMYVQKFPWKFGGGGYPWWKYFKRPDNTIKEFRFLEKNLKQAQAVALIAGRGGNTVKFKNNNTSDTDLFGVSYQYPQITNFEIDEGRYFSRQEVEKARNVVVIGANIAESLFYNISPITQVIKIRGRKFVVIGVLKREGENIFGGSPIDDRLMVPYGAMSKLYKIGNQGIDPVIALKGRTEDEGLYELEGEARGLLRSIRSIKPTEDDNFALNRTEAFADALTKIFSGLTVGGWFIGGFALLVGGFGIANIMFVSVRERTKIIGIQKALGAKNYIILFQFLFEAILLSLIGGSIGVFLVYLITFIPLGSLELTLSLGNIISACVVASFIGVIAGIVPAVYASRLNPVEAIRIG